MAKINWKKELTLPLILFAVAIGVSIFIKFVTKTSWKLLIWVSIGFWAITGIVILIRVIRKPSKEVIEPELMDMDKYKQLAVDAVMHDRYIGNMFKPLQAHRLNVGAINAEPSPIAHIIGETDYEPEDVHVIFNMKYPNQPSILVNPKEEELKEKIRQIATTPEKEDVFRKRTIYEDREVITEQRTQSVAERKKQEAEAKKEEEEGLGG